MSNEQEDERRLYQCVKKYKMIVKQFDELIEMMSSITKPPKRRRSSGASSSASATSIACSNRPGSNQVFVQRISTFLQELRADSTTDLDDSTSTRNQE